MDRTYAGMATKSYQWLKEHLPSAVLGALIGALLGYTVSQVQQHFAEKAAHDRELAARINAVIREIDLNSQWRTNSPAFISRGDTLAIKRRYSNEALGALATNLPALLPEDMFIYRSTTTLQGYISSLNQLIYYRNLCKNDAISRPDMMQLYDSTLNVMQSNTDSFCAWYVDSLKARRPD